MQWYLTGKCKPGTFLGHPHKRGKRSLTHQENGGDKEKKWGTQKEAWGWLQCITGKGWMGIDTPQYCQH